MKQNITSADVARAAGVSQSLVSLALNPHAKKKISPKTREHIAAVAKQMGYRTNMAASGMKSRRANAVGVISLWDINSFVYAPIIDGISKACFDANYAVTVCSALKSNDGRYDFKEYYLQSRIDGVIVISYIGAERTGIFEVLDAENIPYVCVIGCREFTDISTVDVSYEAGGRIAAEHLAQHGGGRVIYIMKNHRDDLNYAEAERLIGCRNTAETYGMEFYPYSGFIGCITEEDYEKAAFALMEYIKTAGQKCAVVSTSFECYSVLKAANKSGINIPRELAVISLDNERYNAYLTPKLTSVRQPLGKMGETAARLLIERITDGRTAKRVVFEPTLSVRDST